MDEDINFGDSAAGKKMGGAFALGGAALGITSGIIKGLQDTKDFCLDPGQAALNTGENFGKNFLNIAGGLGDVFFNAIGKKTPEESLKEQLTLLNQQYRTSFDSFTMSFASAQTSFDEDVVSTMEAMNKTNHAIEIYYKDMLQEEIDLNTIRIIFLFLIIFVIYIFIIIKK